MKSWKRLLVAVSVASVLLLICYSATRGTIYPTQRATMMWEPSTKKSSSPDRRSRVSPQRAIQLGESSSKPSHPSTPIIGALSHDDHKTQHHSMKLVEASSKPFHPSGALGRDHKPQHHAMQLVELSSKPSHPLSAEVASFPGSPPTRQRTVHKPRRPAMLFEESSMCHVPRRNAIQSVEASSKSVNPNWKKFTFQALHPADTPAGNKSCQQTCQCLQSCVPCFCGRKEQCCSEVLLRRPYIPSRVKHKRTVIASIDTKNYFYTWYAPITALIWQNAMDWRFVLLVVYERDEELTPVLKSILQFTEAAGAEILYLKNPLKEPHYLAEMVVTLSRFFSGTFDWPEDTYVMTTDLDMWPLKKSYFDSSVSTDKDIHVLYANYFGNPLTATQYPVCYIGMKVSMWREFMKVSKQDDIFREIARVRDEQWGTHPSKVDQFATDQIYFAKKLHTWRGFPDRVHFVNRPGEPPSKRLDRLYHASCFTLEEVPDAVESHVLRPGFAQENWPRLRALLAHILTEEDLLWVDTYASHFCEIMSCSNTPTILSSYPHYHP